LFSTYSTRENIYCEEKGKISVVLNSSLHESIFFKLVIFFPPPSEYFNTVRGVTPKNYAIGYDGMYVRKI
jgi:hypothetical protein